MAGVSDAYRPSLEHAVRDQTLNISENPLMSIEEATDFYLSIDPTDPQWIVAYRRNLIYSRELRWYLAVLNKEEAGVDVDDIGFYNKTMDNHDLLLDESKIEGGGEDTNEDLAIGQGSPPFSEMEIFVIISEGIKFFFEDELEQQVR
jgi:hypothetical protein